MGGMINLVQGNRKSKMWSMGRFYPHQCLVGFIAMYVIHSICGDAGMCMERVVKFVVLAFHREEIPGKFVQAVVSRMALMGRNCRNKGNV